MNYLKRLRKIKPWDGRYYRIENLSEIQNGSNTILLSDSINYSHIRAFQKLEVSKTHPIDYHTLSVATIGFVHTSDRYIVFGQRDATLNNHVITPIGGGLQPDELQVHTANDLFKNMQKEFNEETGMPNTSIKHIHLNGIIYSKERMIIFFIFHIQINNGRQTVLNHFASIQHSEHDQLLFVSEKEMKSFIADKPEYLQEAYVIDKKA